MGNEPTHARRSLLSLIFALAVITYLDRLCISAAMKSMAAEFNLTPDQIYVMAALFVFGVAMWLLIAPRKSVLLENA
jgi:hypothetical protein